MGGLAQLDIRPAHPAERDAVAALYWRTWHETQAALEPPEVTAMRSRAFFENRVARWPESPLTAWQNGRLVGFAAWQGDYLGQVFVDPVRRGAGVGAQLLSAAETLMARAGTCVANSTASSAMRVRVSFMSAGDGGSSMRLMIPCRSKDNRSTCAFG